MTQENSNSSICSCCHKPKAALECGLCQASLCKYCAQILDESRFSFLPVIPSELSHQVYCSSCFDQSVASPMAEYDEKMAHAKEVAVYFKKQGKETRLIKRIEKPVSVVDCPDYDEAILRMAFMAVLANCNGLVDVELSSTAIKSGSYHTLSWKGSGVPAQINPDRLIKDRSLWQNPN